MVGYYDVVLGAVPLALLGVTGGLYGIGIELTIAVPLAASLAAAVIGHGLFVNAPIETNRPAPEPSPDSPAVAAD